MKRGERKHFELSAMIRAPRKPHKVLSNTCLVSEDGTTGYCYIRFSDKLVEFVGKKLERGIAEFDPAYLEVIKTEKKWAIFACYYLDGMAVQLWETGTRPAWIGTLKRVKPDEHNNTACAGSQPARADHGSAGAPNTGRAPAGSRGGDANDSPTT